MKLWRTVVLALLLILGLLACSSREEAEPKDARAYLNRGIAYAKKGDMNRALEDFSRALVLNPNYPQAYGN